MRHDLLTLELLAAIATSKSITRGAEQVHIALAAASKRVTDLESRLGVRLFLRRARGVEPTEACQVLLKHVRTVRVALDSFDREAIEFSRGVKGYARVALSRDVVVGDLPRDLAAFSKTHKDVHITLRDLKPCEVEDAVAAGTADIGVFLLGTSGSRLQTVPYVNGRWTALVPEHHPMATKSSVAFEDLLFEGIVGSDRAGALSALLMTEADNLGVRYEPRVEADSVEASAALVEAGMGVAIATEAAAQRCCHLHRVRPVALHDTWAHYEVVLGVVQQEELPVLTSRLLNALSQQLRKAVPTSTPSHELLPPRSAIAKAA